MGWADEALDHQALRDQEPADEPGHGRVRRPTSGKRVPSQVVEEYLAGGTYRQRARRALGRERGVR